MTNTLDFDRQFEYENGYSLTAPINRFSKFITHLDLFRMAAPLRGEVVECGVFRGNSLFRFIKFRSLFENPHSRKIIGFDTFGDFPAERTTNEKKQIEAFIKETDGGQSHTREDFLNYLKKLRLDENVELIQGDINQTVPEYLKQNSHLKISLLNVDVDLYEPTKVILENLYPHVVSGGIVILDDYGAMPGSNQAIDDFFAGKGIRIQKLPYSHAISYIQKP